MKRTVVVLSLVIVLAAAMLAVTRRARQPAEQSVLPPVRASSEIVAEAQVVPVRSASLSFVTGGTVAEIPIREGSQVRQGQVLIRLTAYRQVAARVAQAEATLLRARARLDELRAGARPEEVAAARAAEEATLQRAQQAEVALRLAASDLRRTEQLFEDGIVASERVEQARTRYDTARSDLDAARAEVRRMQAEVKLIMLGVRPETLAGAEADLAAATAARREAAAALMDSELRAPFDGVVLALEPKVGEFVAPGVPVAQLADVSGWIVETTDLTELSVARVQVGDTVAITFDALPEVTLAGTVVKIRAHGENRQGDIVYTVTIAPDRHEARLYWNMTASVAITPAR